MVGRRAVSVVFQSGMDRDVSASVYSGLAIVSWRNVFPIPLKKVERKENKQWLLFTVCAGADGASDREYRIFQEGVKNYDRF